MLAIKLLTAAGIMLQGCDDSIDPQGGYPTIYAPTRPGSTTTGPTQTYTAPTSTPAPLACTGRRIGTYAWDQSYWKGSDSSLLAFLDSDVGREWACGDLTISIADFSNADRIHDSGKLVNFIQQYRLRVRNIDAVLWLSYGDVVSKDGSKMIEFTNTFFDWVATIPRDVAISMGKIGISYDVEHLDPTFTRDGLLLAQERRQGTNFAPGSLLIQHTIEGDNNIAGTEYVMQYADNALAMVYRNYMHDPTGRYQDDSNMLNRLMWMLTQQCPMCLDDTYASTHYKAKITIMVEAACAMGNGCGKLSFCAFSGPNEGALKMSDVITQMENELVSTNVLTRTQMDRLFSTETPYASHNWEWYRCFAPFSSTFTYSNCANYQSYASSCRAQ
jgi:hypothetical protein